MDKKNKTQQTMRSVGFVTKNKKIKINLFFYKVKP